MKLKKEFIDIQPHWRDSKKKAKSPIIAYGNPIHTLKYGGIKSVANSTIKTPPIIVSKKAPLKAREIVINKTIVDELGVPLPGVHITNKNTKKTLTITDIDGNYEVRVSSSDVLEFTHVSYITTTYQANEIPNSIKLVPQTNNLEEVVVTGTSNETKNKKKKTALVLTAITLVVGGIMIFSKPKPKKVVL
ncbi:carboxypeptidase-like regulatory domain-containing protein [Tenacibaculum maritimum]|nr:carboxypeptidase-like regulatory domain-containing protein [Tenacibaculum maritimum]